jgi:hypothetical protein
VVEKGWSVLVGFGEEHRTLLQGALLMFHEGILLRERHPSMSLVAFVAAIETAGQIEKPPDPACPRCGFRKGAFRAFKAALVRSGWDGRNLKWAEEVYSDYRSPTVHSAVLHGHESTGGLQTVHIDTSGSHAAAVAFEYGLPINGSGQLWSMEQACKRVLYSYLL